MSSVTVVPADERPPGILAIAGAELTQNLRTCDPPPPPGLSCLLHVNALFLPNPGAGISGVAGDSDQRFEIFRRADAGTSGR